VTQKNPIHKGSGRWQKLLLSGFLFIQAMAESILISHLLAIVNRYPLVRTGI